MENLRYSTPTEVRATINRISKDIRIPHPSAKFPNGEIVVKWETLATVDSLALLGGFRISEIVTKYWEKEGNTSRTLNLETTTHRGTGEEVLFIKVYALKKKSPVERQIGIPLNRKHEPLAEFVWYQWDKHKGNPCNISRQVAWAANRIIFKGLQYRIAPRTIFIRDKKGKFLLDHTIPEHSKYGANHFLRHIRAQELREMQLTPEERVSFFQWSSRGVGLNPMLSTYSQPEWFEYFPKLLKVEKIDASIKA
jgi:hypothetical protein